MDDFGEGMKIYEEGKYCPVTCFPVLLYLSHSHNLLNFATLVQISFLKNSNLDSKKHLKDPFPNPKAQKHHK